MGNIGHAKSQPIVFVDISVPLLVLHLRSVLAVSFVFSNRSSPVEFAFRGGLRRGRDGFCGGVEQGGLIGGLAVVRGQFFVAAGGAEVG